ncbi:MAG: TIGR04086 family membrane protein [Tissierellaceae bacterium]|jgi:putative membrane protein (TIGR04086 family)|nr:TIGR04086 family membrane protein [Tissierellia bacterium]
MKTKISTYNLIRGLILAFIITFTLLLILALVLRFTQVRESSIPFLNNLVFIISIVLTSALLGRMAKESGWLNGALLGFIYYLVILILNLIIHRSLDLGMLIVFRLLMATILGALGGMIGVNLT